MYPVLFEVFGLPISSFGAMMAIGFLVATWLTGLRLREFNLNPELSSTMLLYCMIGGVVGSKLYFAVDVGIRSGQDFSSLFFARDGITWYGGLLGAIAVGALGCKIHGISIRIFTSCVAVGAAVGQAFGRIGCFLVGDDYGIPTSLPWGIAFPLGAPPTEIPVHPTQLYECFWLFFVAAVLWKRRKQSPFLFGEYLIANGVGRFAIESIRTNTPIALGLTQAQWIGLTISLFGMLSWFYYRKTRTSSD
ncbi:prolipoprotein diacylglyceryl transferase [Myxococcota bacterium]|jgi:phosphatidylglycerol:prolipoprotein diacylglycerol transferase|nr:prolipoprotein diacylglyceryl transferase [Myxococcota bacterium]|tara:strand:+ start:6782 stop:7525 length:744 start_codon:yes stop_codon:yes gene_type:complete